MSRREDHEAREADHLADLVEAGEVAISDADGLPVVDGRRVCLSCQLPIEGHPSKLYHDLCRAATLPHDAATMTSREIEDALTDKPVFRGLQERLNKAPKRREL